MRVIVLGGDGFCGWPTTLHFSNTGHDVTVVDNLSRRNIDNELEAYSLTPIQPMGVRLKAWEEVSGKKIGFVNIDIATNYSGLLDLIKETEPDVIIHFAEQRAAPYSMKTSAHKRYTVNNNLNATHNVCAAIVESGLDIHLVHLGTMGVYGYSTTGIKIPEGYLKIKAQNVEGDWVEDDVVYPPNAGSIYHMTKTQDALFFQFYAKNNGLRYKRQHQGVVWGTQTAETLMDDRLINRFDYDGDYGTVLNRFLMQNAVGYPLTVHGTGGHTRAFIHIKDTVNCLSLAVENAPQMNDKVRILNQMTETHRVRDLAAMIVEKFGGQIAYLDNPRKEMKENDLLVCNDQFLSMGLAPTTLSNGLLSEVNEVALKYKERADLEKIPCVSTW